MFPVPFEAASRIAQLLLLKLWMKARKRSSRARHRLSPDDRREALLVSAERMLRKKGLSCRVEDVVRNANAAQGTFYVYFKSWNDLLIAIRGRIFEEFDRLYPRPGALPADQWWPALERMSGGFIDFVLDLGKIHDTVFHGPLVGKSDIPNTGGMVARIKEFLDGGIQAGAFSDLDAAHFSPLIFAVLHEAVDFIAAGANRRRTVAAALHIIKNAVVERSRASVDASARRAASRGS